ncbi:MAG: hypothetical protein R3E51_00805 [Rhizobiaceae bacterium]
MFTAAALGMRDLGNETGHASGKIDEITKEAEHLKDALTDAAGASLTEMFAGTDDLTAFLDGDGRRTSDRLYRARALRP